jgi:hypothetical protein
MHIRAIGEVPCFEAGRRQSARLAGEQICVMLAKFGDALFGHGNRREIESARVAEGLLCGKLPTAAGDHMVVVAAETLAVQPDITCPITEFRAWTFGRQIGSFAVQIIHDRDHPFALRCFAAAERAIGKTRVEISAGTI